MDAQLGIAATVSTPVPYRLCVSFLDAPTVAKGAANFLVLAQNRVQQQFEFQAFDLDRMREALADELDDAADAAAQAAEAAEAATAGGEESSDARSAVARRQPSPEAKKGPLMNTTAEIGFVREALPRDEIPVDAYGQRVRFAVAIAKRYVAQRALSVPDMDCSLPEKWIVFTEASFDDDTYYVADANIAIVSLANWKSWMAPPSALEFIVRMTQAACAAFFLDLPVHYVTKGCLLDFNEFIKDTKQMVLVGTLCATCRARATAARKLGELQAELALLDKAWVGDQTIIGSVASVLKKVWDYDLYVSRGLTANPVETFWDNVRSSSAQESIRLVAAVVLAFMLLKFGLKAG